MLVRRFWGEKSGPGFALGFESEAVHQPYYFSNLDVVMGTWVMYRASCSSSSTIFAWFARFFGFAFGGDGLAVSSTCSQGQFEIWPTTATNFTYPVKPIRQARLGGKVLEQLRLYLARCNNTSARLSLQLQCSSRQFSTILPANAAC